MTVPADAAPEAIDKEIRFAVVLYGGVSLAIYMNGIAQELLNMVRATSENPRPQNGTADVYASVADYLDRHSGERFTHRFVVDIISGTSAGGINGVCLAKGLAKGLDNLEVLERIWLDHGNIDTLLNDKQSDLNRYPSEFPRTSILNSQRMFAKLLEAFRTMGRQAAKTVTARPHVSSLDLFVTATDLRGLQLPILLSDSVAMEKKHKHVFGFSFRQKGPNTEPVDDFADEYDPMLAFASRCTSSFPTAFEPVRINDILDFLKRTDKPAYQTFSTHLARWKQRFFPGYDQPRDGIAVEEREFADGGYLDNHPFGHAIEAIHARKANCPLERKLFYIDPVPEPDEKDMPQQPPEEITFLKNTTLATFSLPGYETIREEINRLKQRNAWLDNVRDILGEVDRENIKRLKEIIGRDIAKYSPEPETEPGSEKDSGIRMFSVIQQAPELAERFWIALAESAREQSGNAGNITFSTDYQERDLDDMIELFGEGYSSYHYTRRSVLTQQLTGMLAESAEIDSRSLQYERLAELLRIWRNEHYAPLAGEGTRNTENIFFRNYDLGFRLRRLDFLRRKTERSIAEHDAGHLFFGIYTTNPDREVPAWSDNLHHALLRLHDDITGALDALYAMRAALLERHQAHPLSPRSTVLHDITDRPVSALTAEEHEKLNGLMDELHHLIRDGFSPVTGSEEISRTMYATFDRLARDYPEISGRLRYVYRFGYDLHDSTTFQLLAGGDYGEGTKVGIHRISPADARNLWDERSRTDKHGRPLSKLAGTSLGAFGAFLEREWRRNDIMWGRLDAAERIIGALLPEEEHHHKRQQFIDEAQNAILKETLASWITELENSGLGSRKDREQHSRLTTIRSQLDTPDWKTAFCEIYDVHREFEPESSLKRLGRSSGILSSMVERLDEGEGISGRAAGYLKKLNTVLLGLLDFSTPKTFRGVLAGYWIQLLLLTALVVMGGGYLMNTFNLSGTPVLFTGFALLVIDLAVWFIRQNLQKKVHRIPGRPITRIALKILTGTGSALLVLALAVLAHTIYGHAGSFFSAYLADLQGVWDSVLATLKKIVSLASTVSGTQNGTTP
ncbi:patatin-like protein [Prosthecochloris sp. ZM_2]|uniref:patatin-like protein n=1 Tax=Prosthecochloris sp. ZM_2 TaxID=2045206 RepID=UPI000DF7D38C|nr:patatin-like protein [Prosthecochloris sp. ZM_2]RNA64048.1 patatin-like protein [Prosthecochloris sp. ZM_2]